MEQIEPQGHKSADKGKPEQEQREEFITVSNPGPKAPGLEAVMEITLNCCKP